ncbi:response regulator [Astrobacterium formosum]|uniref:response regulator n=1 Tax=Astrobacterium formosum TaxID=3069710 RepID=UPI003F509205
MTIQGLQAAVGRMTASSREMTFLHEVNAGRAADVLIADADSTARQMAKRYFECHSIRAAEASGREELHRHLVSGDPAMIILDLRLGADNGLDVLRQIRSRSDVPVIITAADQYDETDRIIGLEFGADDFLTKPFSLRELLARVKAVLRRQEAGRLARTRGPERGGFRFNGWHLERRGRRLSDPTGQCVSLTRSEYALLAAFLEAPRRPLTCEYLLRVAGVHGDVFDRSIDVRILRLRRKLEPDSNAPRVIRTERGVGYVFDAQVESL